MLTISKKEKVALLVYLVEGDSEDDFIYHPNTRELLCSRDVWEQFKDELGWRRTDQFIVATDSVCYAAWLVANHFFDRQVCLSKEANDLLFKIANPLEQ